MLPLLRLRSALPLWAALAATLLPACRDGDDDDEHLVSSRTALVQYASCRDLEADIEDMIIDEIDVAIDRYDGPYGRGETSDDSPAPAEPGAGDSGGRQEGTDYSGTNNQETGVDEADLVKTDGYHIYVLNGRRMHVFGVPTFGELVPEGVAEIEGYPTEMLIDRDTHRAVVFSTVNANTLPEGHPLRVSLRGKNTYDDYYYWRIDTISKITVFDVSDATKPALVREVFFEGNYRTARKIESSVRVAAYSWIQVPALYNWYRYYEAAGHDKALTRALARQAVRAMTIDDFIPRLYVRTPDGAFQTSSLAGDGCQSFYRPSDSHAHGVSSVISFELLGDALRIDADHVLTNYPAFYASTETLVITEAAHDWWWYWRWQDDPEQLNVHAFDISTPGRSKYIGSGRVEGWLNDPFSIDEHDGNLRIATTTALWNRWWDDTRPEPENHVWVLRPSQGELVTVGHLGGIAPGERIMSARMIGAKGFLVTARNVDPLFTLDLSDPEHPRRVGELKVPGFSTYLHPIADGKLLSIGVGGDDERPNGRTQISMFDVGDFAHPKLDMTLPIEMPGEWGYSEALWQHKAFQYWAPKKLLAVPQSTYSQSRIGSSWSYHYLSRLELVNVDTASGLSRKGSIDHSAYYEEDQSHYWSYVDIRRSIFMGDFVYAISDKAVTVHRVSDLGQVSVARLPGYVPGDYYWWW